MSEYIGLNDRIANPELQTAYNEAVHKANDTQPLTKNQVPEEAYEQDKAGWKQAEEHRKQVLFLLEQNKLLTHLLKQDSHVHGPFTFLLNQNHNALRGCQSCGAAWVGVMAGTEDSIRWHEVQEPPEEEEEE